MRASTGEYHGIHGIHSIHGLIANMDTSKPFIHLRDEVRYTAWSGVGKQRGARELV
jgi:hypothetical protein